jgi:heme exporter protein D
MNFYFESLNAFFEMGGHGPYVWSCYFLVFVVLIAIVLMPGSKTRKLKKIALSRKATVHKPNAGGDTDHASAS